jgi:hypothetical protein
MLLIAVVLISTDQLEQTTCQIWTTRPVRELFVLKTKRDILAPTGGALAQAGIRHYRSSGWNSTTPVGRPGFFILVVAIFSFGDLEVDMKTCACYICTASPWHLNQMGRFANAYLHSLPWLPRCKHHVKASPWHLKLHIRFACKITAPTYLNIFVLPDWFGIPGDMTDIRSNS